MISRVNANNTTEKVYKNGSTRKDIESIRNLVRTALLKRQKHLSAANKKLCLTSSPLLVLRKEKNSAKLKQTN
jgi:hypothetical protein